MDVIRPPTAPLIVRIFSWIVALIAGGGIVYLVFNFGYYASGLAAFKHDEKVRRETPIQTEFADPNSLDPNSP